MLDHYQRVRFKKFYRLSNILAIIKLHSIQLPVVRFLKAWRKKEVSRIWKMDFNDQHF